MQQNKDCLSEDFQAGRFSMREDIINTQSAGYHYRRTIERRRKPTRRPMWQTNSFSTSLGTRIREEGDCVTAQAATGHGERPWRNSAPQPEAVRDGRIVETQS